MPLALLPFLRQSVGNSLNACFFEKPKNFCKLSMVLAQCADPQSKFLLFKEKRLVAIFFNPNLDWYYHIKFSIHA